MQRWPLVLLTGLSLSLGGEVFYYLTTRPPAIGVAIHDGEAKVPAPPIVKVVPEKKPVTSKITKDKETDWKVSVEVIPMPPLMRSSSPDDIKVGMAKGQLQPSFGVPCIRTATSDNGQLLEVYVFPGKDRAQVTVAQLQNGVVTASYARVH